MLADSQKKAYEKFVVKAVSGGRARAQLREVQFRRSQVDPTLQGGPAVRKEQGTLTRTK